MSDGIPEVRRLVAEVGRAGAVQFAHRRAERDCLRVFRVLRGHANLGSFDAQNLRSFQLA